MTYCISISRWIVLAMVATTTFGDTAPQRGAKELFFAPGGSQVLSVDPVPSQRGSDSRVQEATRTQGPRPMDTSSQLGLSYWIELIEAEATHGYRVTEERVFHTGEKIRLHFMSNREGRISLLQAGPAGKPSVLFPDPSKNLVDNVLRAGEERVLPRESAWFRFDHNTGEERILVVFAADQVQLDSTLQPDVRGETLLASARSGSKDLILEVDSEDAEEAGTYAVNTSGQPIVLEIVLAHE